MYLPKTGAHSKAATESVVLNFVCYDLSFSLALMMYCPCLFLAGEDGCVAFPIECFVHLLWSYALCVGGRLVCDL